MGHVTFSSDRESHMVKTLKHIRDVNLLMMTRWASVRLMNRDEDESRIDLRSAGTIQGS